MRRIFLFVLVSTLCLGACGPAKSVSTPAQPTQRPAAVAPGRGPAGGQAGGMAGVHPQPGATEGPFGGADVR